MSILTVRNLTGMSTWPAFARIFMTTFAACIAVAYVVILLVDPYGVMPFHLPIERHLASNQRQMYPQILRTGHYDSLVVGTSTSRLLDPKALDRAVGGRFANFAMPSMRAWEQRQAIAFFSRTVSQPKFLLVGLDHEWCYRPGQPIGVPLIPYFPDWAFDDNVWNDFLYLLNAETLEVAGRVISHILGRSEQKLRADGFEVFVPPDAQYDLARARQHIWKDRTPQSTVPTAPATELTERELKALEFPSHGWLEESLSILPPTTRKVLAFVPVHVASMPAPGSREAAVQAECKSRILAIARRHGATLVDWRFASPLTTEDTNYWDALHYRLPVAYRIIDDLGQVLRQEPAANANYRVLHP